MVTSARFRGLYTFTAVGLEALLEARARGVPSLLDSPNTHIREFRKVIDEEAERWLHRSDRSPPSPTMCSRIEEEYRAASVIRVASNFAARSLRERGVPERKIIVQDLEVDVQRYSCPDGRDRAGPLRVCYVGSVDLRKGVVYLLRALRLLGRSASLTIVGATGSRPLARLLARESTGINVQMAAGDPRPTYARSEVLVLPSLEDGFGYVVAEAMASALPVVVTDQCGASEWVTASQTGWIVPSRSPEQLATTLEEAIRNRGILSEMGHRARRTIVDRMALQPKAVFAQRLRGIFNEPK